ncbi:MAG TPA: hypothetical protein DGG95_01270 [Cytophagales bacterium]|jgi:hypothetical protein|nr:hypothetical protein [Cytophagales bacterium]
MMRLSPFLFLIVVAIGCSSKSSSTKVVKPKTHRIWAKGNKYLIDIPVGTRHIHLFERKRTKTIKMN